MKTIVKFTGILLMLMLAGSVSLEAQRGMRGNMNSNGMNRMRMGNDTVHRQGVRSDSLRMRGMRSQMGPGRMAPRGQFNEHRQMYGMQQGMRPGMGRGMRGQMNQAPGSGKGMVPGPMAGMRSGMGQVGHMGWGPMSSGSLVLESVPNVTEKQKKDITDLRLKQQEEMNKFREDMQAKMQTMRDAHKKSMLNILTDEQKKYIDSKQGNLSNVPAKSK